MLKNKNYFCLLTIALLMLGSIASAQIFTPLNEIISAPESFEGKFVTVKGNYFGWQKAPGYPPVTRSDWVLGSNDEKTIYCTGQLPQTFDPMSRNSIGKPITVLAQVRCKDKKPFLVVEEIKTINIQVEKMVSVAQIIFDPLAMRGRYVGLLGVLAKGYGVKGDRMYLLADPTGAIKLGRLPKLYPKGTILHLKGYIRIDKDGLPMLDEIEIIDARVD